MTTLSKEQVLEKAIQKAIDSGWEYRTFICWDEGWKDPTDPVGQVMAEFYEHYGGEANEAVFERDLVSKLIFNHDFARALWGEKIILMIVPQKDKSISGWLEAWKGHLQMMIIAEDPIQYLKDNI